MIAVRYSSGVALLGLAVLSILTPHAGVLAACAAGGLVVRPVVFRGRAAWLSAVPIVVFAGGLALLEIVTQGRVSRAPVRALAVFSLLTAASRVWPWPDLLGRIRPGGLLWAPALFALVTRHFVEILQTETVRVVRAWSWRAPHRFGPLAFRSLSLALVAIFTRCWIRAERFYAAQRLRGLGT